MRLLALLALSAVALSGCGGGSETTVTETVGAAAPTTQTDKTTPSGTRSVPSEWTDRWCAVKIGDTREEATAKMGAYPTEEDSGKIPLIPYVKIGPDGQNENEGPPTPAGSDTWEAPGTYQFNAFFDKDLRVQQLDFNGPKDELPCAIIRIH
jgi:hypothetical protein